MISIQRWVFRQIWILKANTEPFLALAGFFWLLVGFFLSSTRLHLVFRWWEPFLLFLAFFSARTAGMSLNRLIDRDIDQKNPRTESRLLPSQRASFREISIQGSISSVLFIGVSLFLSVQLQIVAIFILFAITIYSYMKRYTYLCHFVLGSIHFCIPLTGALWAQNAFSSITLSVWCSSIAAFFSVASSDIFYSIQDKEIDRKLGLYSIPACFGANRATQIAIGCYILAYVFASLSLYLSGSAGLLLALALFYMLILGFSWRYFSQDGYISIEKQLFFMLPLLPCICATLVSIRWFNLDTILLEFLGLQELFLGLR